MSLSDRRCVPCNKGEPPLTVEKARALSQQVPQWTLSEYATRLRRRYRFDDFQQALAFVNTVGELAEEEGHHPEIRFGWGHAEIEIWTHKIDGLHQNDFILAARIDARSGL